MAEILISPRSGVGVPYQDLKDGACSVSSLGEHRSGTHQQTTQEALRLLLTLFVQGPLPDHDRQQLPPHRDTLVAFVRRAWSPPAPTRPLSLQDLAALPLG